MLDQRYLDQVQFFLLLNTTDENYAHEFMPAILFDGSREDILGAFARTAMFSHTSVEIFGLSYI